MEETVDAGTKEPSSCEVTSNQYLVVITNTNNGEGSNIFAIFIKGHKLNERNFLQWSQSIIMFVCG